MTKLALWTKVLVLRQYLIRIIFIILIIVTGKTVSAQIIDNQFNDYPTEARAEYVFACMATNGQNLEVLRDCSCSIDVIATIIPYKKYVEAETVLSLQNLGGERMSVFRDTQLAKNLVADLRRAQAEAEVVCF